MESNKLCLYLSLKKEWFNLIDSGDKREEYREIKPYWEKRLLGKSYERVVFSYGYTRRRMCLELLSVSVGIGKHEWGAPPTPVFILELGKRIY